MICTIVHQLTRDLTPEQVKKSGFGAYYVDHTAGVWPQAASGVPFSAATFQSVGDPITDLSEDLAAEQKARTTYDNLLRLIDDPDVREPLKFLREREIVHFQRFGEALRIVQDHLDSKKIFMRSIQHLIIVVIVINKYIKTVGIKSKNYVSCFLFFEVTKS